MGTYSAQSVRARLYRIPSANIRFLRPADKGVCECDRAQQQSASAIVLVVPCSSSGSSWFILSEFSLCVPLSRFVLSPVVSTHPQISNKCSSSSYRHRLYSPRKTPAISLAPYCPPIPPVCPGGGGGGGPAPPGLISCAYLQLSPREQTPLWKSKQLPTCVTQQQQRDRIGGEGVLLVSAGEEA